MSTKHTDDLHAAVCNAVALLNVCPAGARIPEVSQAHGILRQALISYADSFMSQPVTESERETIARKHQRATTKATQP